MNTTGLLRKTCILLGVMIGLALGIGYALPDTFHVERALVVNAPPDKVFPWVHELEKWPKWDPWSRADPYIKHSFKQQKADKGAQMNWQGPKSGNGTLTIVELEPNKRVKLALSTHNVELIRYLTFSLEDLGGRTRLKWAIDGQNSMRPIGNWFGLGMDKYLGPMYEQGLSNIKALTETGSLPPEVRDLKAETKKKQEQKKQKQNQKQQTP